MTIDEAIKELKIEFLGEYSRQREAKNIVIEALEKKCHNENRDYDSCDQFVCSNCGIEFQDWHAVERSEDGDITFHEYEFKYCPNCGARIGGEE